MPSSLESTAAAMVAPGKGILAADEGAATIVNRFDSIGVESTEDNRRAYRQLLFTTPGIEEFISGVILFDETLHQRSDDGTPFAQLLLDRGIIPGAKVDTGTVPLAGFPGEQITVGLDDLRQRVAQYRDLGVQFGKWRAVIAAGPGLPTTSCIEAQAHGLARYAALCQEGGIVPIVEPEVLMDGDHTIVRCAEITEAVLAALFNALHHHRVLLEGIVVKPSMVLSGKEYQPRAGVEEVARATLDVFRRTIPAAVPGIAFLSGGQSPQEATAHLNAMNAIGGNPWELSFSYGRALQQPVLKAWGGEAANGQRAQQAFYLRAQCNSAARTGSYSDRMEAA